MDIKIYNGIDEKFKTLCDKYGLKPIQWSGYEYQDLESNFSDAPEFGIVFIDSNFPYIEVSGKYLKENAHDDNITYEDGSNYGIYGVSNQWLEMWEEKGILQVNIRDRDYYGDDCVVLSIAGDYVVIDTKDLPEGISPPDICKKIEMLLKELDRH